MSAAFSYYVTTILVYLGVDILAVWSLNLQYGVTGIYNFAWIMFQAVGAYTAGVLTLGPATGNGGFELRTDYQAMVMLVISVIAVLVVENVNGLFNGPAGLSLVPQPFGSLPLSSLGYQWFYVALTAVVCLIVYLFVHRVTSSPLGRALRATRDNEEAAQALGKDVVRLRLFVFVLGGAIAGISGALLIQFIGAWSPGSWAYVETLVVLTAIIVGGTGNNAGVMLGALLVPVAFNEATRFIPQFGRPGLVDAMQWIVIGMLALAFLWFWPRGIIPERRRRFTGTPAASVQADLGEVA